MLKVLIIDDQLAVRTALEVLFDVNGIPTIACSTPAEALRLITTEDIGAVVQDMNFTVAETSGREGTELFFAIRALDADLPVLLMTAFTSLEAAVALVKQGAADYLAKPWEDDKVVATVKNLMALRALHQENTFLRARGQRTRRELAQRYDLRGLVYTSDAIGEVVRLSVNIAASDAPVLITGPNGSGKEKIAEIVQANSRRRDKPFVRVNVGAVPDNLFEAELFGAEPGAYTGANKLRIGRFESAHGGTLFLDELGTLPFAAQAKLLRVLQSGEYERLGSSTTRKADVRVISATNLDLQRAIAAGTFREDLYFRLHVIELFVPPLAERPEDIMPLAEHFLQMYAARENKVSLRLSKEAVTALQNHEWPGNVRELQNRVQRAVLVALGDAVTANDLGIVDSSSSRPRKAGLPSAPTREAVSDRTDPFESERAGIEEALNLAQGVISKAAAALGMSRQSLYRRMERLGLTIERRVG